MTGQEDEAPGVNRPTPFWWDRDEGQTDNENEEEDKIGTAGASEEEDNE